MKEYTVRVIEIYKVCADDLFDARKFCEEELKNNKSLLRDLIVIGEAEAPGEKTAEFVEDFRAEEVKNLGKRIAQLHSEIQKRDRLIAELEQEIKIKDEIIRKQVVLLSKTPSSFC
jgi:hypothetical protein